MIWYETIIAAHLRVTDAVSHGHYLYGDRYFVWQEDGANDLIGDGEHIERAVTGTSDLFTKLEFDPWREEIEASFEQTPNIAWAYNSFQYEEETGFYHHEWTWSVIDDGYHADQRP